MFEECTCDNCEFHQEFFDEVEGKTYHDGCICRHVKADRDFHDICCNSQEPCPYKKENNLK